MTTIHKKDIAELRRMQDVVVFVPLWKITMRLLSRGGGLINVHSVAKT